MNISDNNEPNKYGEVEIYETLDAPEETITYENPDIKSTKTLEDAQNSEQSEDKEKDMN